METGADVEVVCRVGGVADLAARLDDEPSKSKIQHWMPGPTATVPAAFIALVFLRR